MKKSISLILTSIAILLCFIFLLNKYPLFWFDSNTYLSYTMTNEWHTYGSILYPQLLRLVLYFQSPWIIILIQSIISSYVLLEFIKTYFNKYQGRIFIGFTFILCFSSYGIFTTTMMPDIFLGLGILSNYIILSQKIKVQNILIYLIYISCLIAHNGNMYIFLLINIIIGFLFVLKKDWVSMKSLGICFVLIFGTLFFVKPIVGSMYANDKRGDRNINFYCRQIHISSFNGYNSFKELLRIGCANGIESEVCKYNPTKNDLEKLKQGNNLEADCKIIFLTALSNLDFLKTFVKTKISNLKFLIVNFKNLRNSGSNIIVHNIIQKKIPSETFLPITQSLVNTNYDTFLNRLQVIVDVSWLLIRISYFLIFASIFLIIFKKKMKNRVELFPSNRSAFLVFYILLAILISLVFYTLFSNFTNFRYSIRLSWLIILLASTLTLDFILKKWFSQNQLD